MRSVKKNIISYFLPIIDGFDDYSKLSPVFLGSILLKGWAMVLILCILLQQRSLSVFTAALLPLGRIFPRSFPFNLFEEYIF